MLRLFAGGDEGLSVIGCYERTQGWQRR